MFGVIEEFFKNILSNIFALILIIGTIAFIKEKFFK